MTPEQKLLHRIFGPDPVEPLTDPVSKSVHRALEIFGDTATDSLVASVIIADAVENLTDRLDIFFDDVQLGRISFQVE